MKATTIINGKTKLILQAEGQQDILTMKGLDGKILKAEFLEQATLINESSPDCLVITENEKEKVEPYASESAETCKILFQLEKEGEVLAILSKDYLNDENLISSLIKQPVKRIRIGKEYLMVINQTEEIRINLKEVSWTMQ